jgi:hypothetical protein
MVVGNLSLYDVLVDIFPGIVTIVIFLPFAPEQFTTSLSPTIENLPVLTAAVLGFGYLIGRTVHFLSGWVSTHIGQTPMGVFVGLNIIYTISFTMILYTVSVLLSDIGGSWNQAGNYLLIIISGITIVATAMVFLLPFSEFLGVYREFVRALLNRSSSSKNRIDLSIGSRLNNNNFENLYRLLPVEYPDEHVETWLENKRMSLKYPYSRQSGYFEREIKNDLINRIESNYPFKITAGKKNLKTDTNWVRYIGYSNVFDKSTLYQRYNILATFFRNISLTLWIGLFVYGFYGLLTFASIDVSGVNPWWGQVDQRLRFYSVLVLFVITLSSSLQLSKFSHYRNRQFVLDFYRYLRSD